MGFQGVVVYQGGDHALSGDAEAGCIGGYADRFFQGVAFDQEGGQGGDEASAPPVVSMEINSRQESISRFPRFSGSSLRVQGL